MDTDPITTSTGDADASTPDAFTPPPPPSSIPPAPTQAVASSAASDSTRRNWGAMAHGSALIASVVAGLAVLGPLVVWLVKKDEDPWIGQHALESLNFQLTWFIGAIIGGIVGVIGTVLTVGLGLILFAPAALGLLIAWFVFTIKGALAASRGESYRYPMSVRMIS